MASRVKRREDPPLIRPLPEIVPPRAVLTELARGFLMVQQSDPVHAARFARSFLKEHVGPSVAERVVPSERIPMVRRGVATSLQDHPFE